MGKKRLILFAAFLVIALGGTWWAMRPPREPEYQGRKLSAWLEEIYRDGGTNAEAEQAVRELGTNALAMLLRFAGDEDTATRMALLRLSNLRPQPGAEVRTEEQYHLMAGYGFHALGETARPAVPALIGLLSSKNPSVRESGALSLGCIGPPAKEAVPALMKLLDDPKGEVQFRAAGALGSIHAESRLVVQVLTEKLRQPPAYLSYVCLVALGQFAGDANAAVPTIVPLLTNEDARIRVYATNALKQIDPDAAANAGIK